MTFRRTVLFALLMPVLLLASARVAFGQLDQGTITGVIEDPSGAAIPGAAVTLTNVDLGQVLKTTTDGSGLYVFSPVKIGNYSITAGAPNFQTTTQTGIHLSIQQRLNVIVMLKPGAATETVTVTTEVPLMQTQESSVGQTMDTQTINSVPLASRNWVYIAQLSAGAALPAGSRGGSKGDFQANGQRAEENNFILDGVDNNANVVDFYNGASYVVNPPPDALAEFKVQTSTFSAEFGQSAGAVVNVSIKSGTNSLHGSLWEFGRNSFLDAEPYFQPAGAAPKFIQNQYGATAGAPIIKNRTFFFFAWQSSREVNAAPQLAAVPSLSNRAGIFTQTIYDPATTAANPNGTGSVRTPFPGNVVPANRIDPVSRKLLALYPAPNLTGKNNFFSNQEETVNNDQYIGRIEIFDDYSLVDLPEGMPRETFRDLQKVWVCGQQLKISRVQDEQAAAKPARKPKKPGKRF